jgi:tripeptide aminopeptidase
MDTVNPAGNVHPVIQDGIIRSDGQTILGGDDRVAVAAILYVLQEIAACRLKSHGLEVVFSVAEELGMLGAQSLDSDALKAREGYVFDCSRDIGSYVCTTPTALHFAVRFKGRAAHSGVNPERGVNALTMAIETMRSIPVGRVDRDTVANIGIIRGGEAVNIVPESVEIKGEIRSFNEAKIASMQSELIKNCHTAAQKFGGEIEPDFRSGFKGFILDETHPAVKRLERVLRDMGLKPKPLIYYGGSDANVLNSKGIATVNVATGVKNPHSSDEHIAVKDLVRGAELIMRLVSAEQ